MATTTKARPLKLDGSTKDIRVAVIGCGYWGPNLIRNFFDTPGCQLTTICDLSEDRLAQMQRRHPSVRATTSVDDVLRDPAIDAVAIATPVHTHAKLAEAALKKIPAARDRLRSDKLRKQLDTLETEAGGGIRTAIAAAEQAMKQQQAEAGAREEKLLTAAKLQIKELCENYRFIEAAALIRTVDVKLDRSISERELLTRRVEWLIEFKKHLIEDINTAGCVAPLVKKNGQKLLGTASRADDQQIDLRVQFGVLPAVKWIDISPMSILQMARSFMRPTLSQAAIADREWQASVFCLFTQLFNEGQALMDDAVNRKPEYQNDRALFFGQSAPTPAPTAQ